METKKKLGRICNIANAFIVLLVSVATIAVGIIAILQYIDSKDDQIPKLAYTVTEPYYTPEAQSFLEDNKFLMPPDTQSELLLWMISHKINAPGIISVCAKKKDAVVLALSIVSANPNIHLDTTKMDGNLTWIFVAENDIDELTFLKLEVDFKNEQTTTIFENFNTIPMEINLKTGDLVHIITNEIYQNEKYRLCDFYNLNDLDIPLNQITRYNELRLHFVLTQDEVQTEWVAIFDGINIWLPPKIIEAEKYDSYN